MHSRIVLLLDGRAVLYLSDVKRNPDGSLKSGDVANGAWRFEVRGGEVLAKDSWTQHIVNRWPLPEYTEVPVLPEWRGDYNEIMRLAQIHHDGNS